MKPRAVDLFVCPTCQGALEPVARLRRGAEILEGCLLCAGCKASWPIRRGVPRFVIGDEYAGSFGYQWNRFRAVQLDSCNGGTESDSSFRDTTGWTADSLAGSRVLDVGVGAGRYAEVAARLGAEVVGIDLTHAVDAAYHNVGEKENVHLAQADIFAMPFRPDTFDRAYSIGVLHHTPDPRAAFERVARLVKVGGHIAIYVYVHPGASRHFTDTIRKVTTRLPLPAMLALSTAAIPLYYAYRLPFAGRLLHLVAPISMHPSWRTRWLDTFDWYTPRYQWKLTFPEVFAWFRDNGFSDVTLSSEPIRMRGVRTRERAAGAEAPPA